MDRLTRGLARSPKYRGLAFPTPVIRLSASPVRARRCAEADSCIRDRTSGWVESQRRLAKLLAPRRLTVASYSLLYAARWLIFKSRGIRGTALTLSAIFILLSLP